MRRQLIQEWRLEAHSYARNEKHESIRWPPGVIEGVERNSGNNPAERQCCAIFFE